MPRKAIKVNKDILVDSIKKVEDKQEFSKRGDLYEAVAKEYNSRDAVPEKIKPQLVYNKIRKWKLEDKLKTRKGKRGGSHKGSRKRKSSPIKKETLVKAIETVESKRTFKSRGDLYKAVAKEYNNNIKDDGFKKDISHSTVYMYVRSNNLEKMIKTKMGKRGRPSSNKTQAVAKSKGKKKTFVPPSELKASLDAAKKKEEEQRSIPETRDSTGYTTFEKLAFILANDKNLYLKHSSRMKALKNKQNGEVKFSQVVKSVDEAWEKYSGVGKKVFV